MPSQILLVDDDASQMSDLAEIVRSFGYRVSTAADGQEALAKLASLPIGAILTDLVMPRMDGVAFLKEMAARGDRTPTVVLTGFGSVEQAISLVHDLKAFWFLEKPVQPGVLRTLLERADSAEPTGQRNGAAELAAQLPGHSGRSGWQLTGHEGSVFAHSPGGAHLGVGTDQRRKRHWQRAGGARYPHFKSRATQDRLWR